MFCYHQSDDSSFVVPVWQDVQKSGPVTSARPEGTAALLQRAGFLPPEKMRQARDTGARPSRGTARSRWETPGGRRGGQSELWYVCFGAAGAEQQGDSGKHLTVPSSMSLRQEPKSARRMWPFMSSRMLSGLMSLEREEEPSNQAAPPEEVSLPYPALEALTSCRRHNRSSHVTTSH